MSLRSYRVQYKRDLRREMAGFDWRLYTFGPGHWCVGTGHSGTFQTEAEAHDAGRDWVATGRARSTKIAAGHAPAPTKPTGEAADREPPHAIARAA